jgi:hypothetical protein
MPKGFPDAELSVCACAAADKRSAEKQREI